MQKVNKENIYTRFKISPIISLLNKVKNIQLLLANFKNKVERFSVKIEKSQQKNLERIKSQLKIFSISLIYAI